MKLKLSLCLTKYHEDVWSGEGIAPLFLTSALDGGEWLTSPQGKKPLVSIGEEMLGVHQNQSGRRGVQKNLSSLQGGGRTPRRRARRYPG
jgi:hypothetical protein